MTEYRIPWNNRSDRPGELGRHVNHDPRSRAFAHQPSNQTLQTKVWDRHFPVLDQGATGSCTGNAMLGAVYTGPVFSALSDELRAKFQATEAVARDVLYHLATMLDTYVGTYPPIDTGSDGVSVCKAAQQLGLISGFRHAFSLDDALATLSNDSHVITGVNWYPAFDRPNAGGLVTLPKVLGRPDGGHEFLVYGIDAEMDLVLARNSWGTGWADEGEFAFSFEDWGRLLEQDGDVTVPVPISAPAPTPVKPQLTVLEEFEKAYAALLAWLKAHL